MDPLSGRTPRLVQDANNSHLVSCSVRSTMCSTTSSAAVGFSAERYESMASTSRAARTDHSSVFGWLLPTTSPLGGNRLAQLRTSHYTPSIEIGLPLRKRLLLPLHVRDAVSYRFANERARSYLP